MRNLTEISLKNKSLVWYFIIVVFIAGCICYTRLGRMEDPTFTIRQMVISVAWPGATSDQMESQVTDKIEKKLQETPGLDYIKSYSRSGEAVIYVNLDDKVPTDKIRPTWLEVRNLVEDMKKNLPKGVYGPYYNDRFDDVYGTIYTLTGDGYSYAQLKEKAEKIRGRLLRIKQISKVELIGVQQQSIFIDINKIKLAELGISPQDVMYSIKSQQNIVPAGMINGKQDNVYLRVSGEFTNIEQLRDMPINAGGHIIRLGDIATVESGYSDPAAPKVFYGDKPAIGIAISMAPGGNILKLGDNLDMTIDNLQAKLPAGMELHQVSNQPQVVKNAIDEFVGALREAVIIVLAVSFLSLGFRTGLVVAGCIPLVLAGVFIGMDIFGIDLHKVSLGALIISLGLLVDDEIIAVEMMSVKLEEGLSRFDAACYAFRATAIPMLSGTLITCCGFIPVAFSYGLASEFCKALFPVIVMALLLSWIVSVMVAPLYGYKLIRVKVKTDTSGKNTMYDTKFYVMFKKLLHYFLYHRKVVLSGTLVVFILSLVAFRFVSQEFFPPSLRPELVVEMTLPEGSSLHNTQIEAEKFSKIVATQQAKMENYTYYVGEGAPRFVLTFEPELPRSNYAQFIITAKDTASRNELAQYLQNELATQFPEVDGNIKFLQIGPPAAYPVMIRVSGYDKDKVRALSQEIAQIMRQDSNLYNINFDWQEKGKALRIQLDQDKIKSMGISTQMVSQSVYTEVSGATAAEYYTDDDNINMIVRLDRDDISTMDKIRQLPIYLGPNGYIPLEQIAHISYEGEDSLIGRRNLLPTITVQANIHHGTANDATKNIYAKLQPLQDKLPWGYSIEPGGAMEQSTNAIGFLVQPIPVMLLLIITILMFQLRSIKLTILTLLTAPLGLIGVSFGMLIFNKPIGFVAMLGILALSGMIIRNSIILIDQIQQHLAAGEDPYHAIVDSAILRFRPIMLTAAAAILGMLPLVPSNLWGSMAIAISCGLLVATILTLLVLPTMYAVMFKVQNPQ